MFVKKLMDKNGDFTIEGAIKLILISMILVFALSALGLANQASTLNALANEAMRYIEIRGRVDSAVYAEMDRLEQASGMECTFSVDADYMRGSDKVQFGDAITLRVEHTSYFGVGGVVKLPITLAAQAEGRSERYWK